MPRPAFLEPSRRYRVTRRVRSRSRSRSRSINRNRSRNSSSTLKNYLGKKVADAFRVDVMEGLEQMFKDPDDTSLLEDKYRFEERQGESGDEKCRRHIWILKSYSTIIGKLRQCNNRIEIKVSEHTSRYVEYVPNLQLTPTIDYKIARYKRGEKV
jgi:hypothetical protein